MAESCDLMMKKFQFYKRLVCFPAESGSTDRSGELQVYPDVPGCSQMFVSRQIYERFQFTSSKLFHLSSFQKIPPRLSCLSFCINKSRNAPALARSHAQQQLRRTGAAARRVSDAVTALKIETDVCSLRGAKNTDADI